ncbi:MAG: TonB-dependent receptor [Lysobacteraceae bacterium]|nr:MAG: TonB-dependent receptor [Xanthomonadaceae bacterium]
MRTVRRTLLARSLALALCTGGSLAAPVSSAQTRDSADAGQLDTITVTAQRREQAVQDVPIALQVVTEKLMENVVAEDIGDLDNFVPGLSVNRRQVTQPSMSLRGISTRDFGIGTDAAVGVYVDGVYAGRGAGMVLPFVDVERIEVIKGPQGTLFGRNTAAGALSIVTRAPSARDEGSVSMRVGGDDKRYLAAMGNMAFGDDSALRFNGVFNQSDGWLRDARSGEDLNPENEWAGRLSFRTALGEATRFWVSWGHEDLDQRGRPIVGIVDLPAAPGLPPIPVDESALLDPLRAPAALDVVDGDETREYDGVRLIIDHDFSWGDLTSTTAWHRYDSYNRIDEDGTTRRDLYIDTTNEERNRGIYQDLRLEVSSGAFDWVAGASHYREDGRQSSSVGAYTDTIDTLLLSIGGAPTPDGTLYRFFDQVLQANGIPLTLLGHRWDERFVNTLDTRSYALYGDAIWHANDKLNLTFGLRYTRDRKSFTWFNPTRDASTLDATLDQLEALGFFGLAGVPRDTFVFDAIFVDPPALAAKGVVVRDAGRWSDLSPRLVADYRFSEGLMGYASLAKGYKAGGFNAVQIGSRFDNEDVWNAEIGFKHTIPSARLQYAVSLYRYRYDDRQAIRLDTSLAIPRYVVDTADLQAWGLDLDGRWQATERFGLNFNAAYIDSSYRSYTSPEGVRLDGQSTGTPHWNFAFGLDYDWTLGDAGRVLFALNHSYRGRTQCNDESAAQGSCIDTPAFELGEAQHQTDARASWRSPSGRWGVGLYAKNLGDRRHVESLARLARAIGVVGAELNEPRSYGLEVDVKF